MADMNMSFFEKAKLYYDNGVWDDNMLMMLVRKGKLTDQEYNIIVNIK